MAHRSPDLVESIDALLPQTQCTRCGYPDCRSYAEAVAADAADINRCPPGGDVTVARLAALTGRPARALDPLCGPFSARRLAVIDEAWCIGCTLCIQACPVDAIIGASKRMHAILVSHCTGCELCLPPCPVDCIELQPSPALETDPARWLEGAAPLARQRYRERHARLAGRLHASRSDRLLGTAHDRRRRRALIADAVARVRSRCDSS